VSAKPLNPIPNPVPAIREMTSFRRMAAGRSEGRRGDRRWKQGITEGEALAKGLKDKSAEFVEKDFEVYAKE